MIRFYPYWSTLRNKTIQGSVLYPANSCFIVLSWTCPCYENRQLHKFEIANNKLMITTMEFIRCMQLLTRPPMIPLIYTSIIFRSPHSVLFFVGDSHPNVTGTLPKKNKETSNWNRKVYCFNPWHVLEELTLIQLWIRYKQTNIVLII